MDIRSLRYFNEIVKYKSMRRAGDSLHMTQPALSRHIKVLEDELGVPLFVRNARGVTPTDAAQVLAMGARQLFEDVDRLTALVRSLAPVPAGKLRLGVLPAFGRHFAASVIADMQREYPRLRFQLVEAFSEKLRQMVLADDLDAAVVAELDGHPDLARAGLYAEQLWLIGHHGSSLPDVRTMTYEKLRGYPLIASRFVIDAIKDRVSAHDLNVLEIDGASVLPDLLRKNAGVYLGPPTMVWEELRSGEFVGASFQDLSFKREMVWRKDRPQSPAVAMLYQNSLGMLTEFAALPRSPIFLAP